MEDESPPFLDAFANEDASFSSTITSLLIFSTHFAIPIIFLMTLCGGGVFWAISFFKVKVSIFPATTRTSSTDIDKAALHELIILEQTSLHDQTRNETHVNKNETKPESVPLRKRDVRCTPPTPRHLEYVSQLVAQSLSTDDLIKLASSVIDKEYWNLSRWAPILEDSIAQGRRHLIMVTAKASAQPTLCRPELPHDLVPCEQLTVSNSALEAADSESEPLPSSGIDGFMISDAGEQEESTNSKGGSPLPYHHDEPTVPRNFGAISDTLAEVELELDGIESPSSMHSDPMDDQAEGRIFVKPSSPPLEERIMTTGPLPKMKSSSWNVDKRPSLSSLSSASFTTDHVDPAMEANEESADVTAREQADEPDDAIFPQANSKSKGKHRRRKNRLKSRTPTILAPALIPTWASTASSPVEHCKLSSPCVLPPPGLSLRPPPGLDHPKRQLRADAPVFTPRFEFPLPPPPPGFLQPEPLGSPRTERSSTMASGRSARTWSSDGDQSYSMLQDEFQVVAGLRGTPTDDGHDADDELDSYYEGGRPSVDLSFLES